MAPKAQLALSFLAAATLIGSAAAVSSTASAQLITEGGRTFTATLSGANEVPSTTETGTGRGIVAVNVRQKRLCYDLEVTGLEDETLVGAHIHRGPAGVNGPVVVPLALPSDGDSDGCVDISARLAAQIWARPEQYYINVHTSEFPAGAIRGQLG